MMLEPSIYDLLDKVPSRYQLVNVVAHQARQISTQAEDEGYPLDEKPVTLALKQIARGEVEPEAEEEQ